MRMFLSMFCVLALCASVATADNLAPPEWYDDGNPTNTFQAWEFCDEATWQDPTLVDNPFGEPCASATQGGTWLDQWSYPQAGYDLRQGVLVADSPGDMLQVFIPNDEDLTQYKEIQIQLTLATLNQEFISNVTGGFDVEYCTLGITPDIQQTGEPQVTVLGDGWLHVVDNWRIEPQPDCEWYWVELGDTWPEGVPLVVDEVVVHTRCVPEPSTLWLLGAGALGLLVWRRK